MKVKIPRLLPSRLYSLAKKSENAWKACSLRKTMKTANTLSLTALK